MKGNCVRSTNGAQDVMFFWVFNVTQSGQRKLAPVGPKTLLSDHYDAKEPFFLSGILEDAQLMCHQYEANGTIMAYKLPQSLILGRAIVASFVHND